MSTVSIIDYGVGNLLSVARAFSTLNQEVRLITTPEEIRSAERLVLPGVGAFEDGMQGLKTRQFIEPIKEFAQSAKPFLGICLGMQMMLTQSNEFGQHQGLDLIPGEVVAIPSETVQGQRHKIPHIGWNELIPTAGRGTWADSILRSTMQKSCVYFVHSFMALPDDPKARLAETLYGGIAISAVIQRDNLYGCQFHPEKSGEVGLNIIKEFLAV